jgi:iron complex outermembrane recepter protein
MRFWMLAALGGGLVPAAAGAQTPVLTPASESAPATAPATAPAEDGRGDYTEVSLEELLSKNVAVAATKTRVDVAKAPVSVTVLTAEEIRRSGVTRLGDLFRTVPGLDVMESFPGHISVSARGTSEVFVNNMLVLVDGRRLEFQVAGVPFFENAPLRLEDIKRIEVVKGPAGALYGTNALAGIISITTFSPEESQGTLVSLTGGEHDTALATVRHGGRIGDRWTYKVLAGYTYSSTFSSDALVAASPAGVRKADALLVLERSLGADRRLDVEAGLAKGDLASLSVNTYQTRFFTWPHLRVAYASRDTRVELSGSGQDSELREFGTLTSLPDRRAGSASLSADHTLAPFSASRLTVGGNLRYQRSTFINIATPHSQVVWGVFAQDEQTVVKDRVTLYGAVGVSGHPEIPTQVDGNLALVVTPVRDHTLRVSAGRAHRDPSFNENFLNFPRRIGQRDGLQIPNLTLRPETLRSLEAGYHGRFKAGTGSVRLFAEGYVEEVEDLINIINRTVPAGSVAGRPTVTILQQFQNSESRDGWGVETGAEWSRGPFGLLGQYAYQSFEDARTQAEIVRDTPRHKVSGAVSFKRGAVEVDVWGHSVSRTTADDGYFLLNPRLGVRHGSWAFSVGAWNALDDKHVETINGTNVKGEVLRRAVSVNLTYGVGGGPRR